MLSLFALSVLSWSSWSSPGRALARHQRSATVSMDGSTYAVRLQKPLGIIFEEVNIGEAEGVVVAGLVEDGNADRDGRISIGDRLMRVSAVQFGGQESLVKLGGGAQFTSVSRNLIPCLKLPFDTIMAAIASNEGRWGYTDVALELRQTDATVPRAARTGTQRVDRTNEAEVSWDGARGTTVNGVSTPMRPGKDNFDL